MATPVKVDARQLHRRLAIIIARQVKKLGDKQRSRAGLDLNDVRQFKLLADALDDQIKLRRVLDDDLEKYLERLPDNRLEEVAKHAPDGLEVTPRIPARVSKLPRGKY